LHAPQWLVLVRMFVSQPLAALPSQLPQPELQLMVHAPSVQPGVPLVPLHAVPHPPQCVVLVCVFVSQPLAVLPSQLPQPELQLMVHAPAVHPGVPLVPLQTVPHAPQWVALVCVFVSQPSFLLPLQSPKPVLQFGAHAPAVQGFVPLAAMHWAPHPPQLLVVVRLVSQPLVEMPSQFPQPELHALIWHDPVAQVAVAFVRLQAVPHEPQFVSVVRLASQPLFLLPSQSPKPGLQTGAHAPPVQAVGPFALVQLAPHAPQLLVVVRLASQPLALFPSQLPKPELHAPMLQVPVVHEAAALANEQTDPQLPQLISVVRLVSQPSFLLPLQSPKPGLQTGEQELFLQLVVPFAFVHVVPHAPQWSLFDLVSTSQPLLGFPSQLPKPELQ
jgi:hypothetical protein